MKNTEITYSKLGANEKAIIDKIKIKFLKEIALGMLAIKLKLQWSGWLQYVVFLPIALLLFIIGGSFYLSKVVLVSKIFFGIGILLLIKIILDIITVKFKVRFPEPYPKRNDSKNVFELMQQRHSCRSFQTRKLRQADLDELMRSVDRHLSEQKLSDKPIRLEYISAPIRVWPTVNASEFLIAIAPKEYNRLAIMDVGKTLQKVVIDATRIGLGTCWIGPGADHKSITDQLGEKLNPINDNIICVCAIGYESWYTPLFIKIFNKTVHKRIPISSLFFNDYEMQVPLDTTQVPLNYFEKNYEACRWAPSSYNGQTTRCIAVANDQNEIERFDFFATTSSKYYATVAVGIWCANWEMGCKALQIDGKFTVLTKEQRNLSEKQKLRELPIYYISWS